MSNAFPFAAIVGQEDMKLAMIMTAIDPKIGGVTSFWSIEELENQLP